MTQVPSATRVGSIGGLVRPVAVGCNNSHSIGKGDPSNGGTPPLTYHGGPVMSTPSVSGKTVVTPIFWEPSGYSFTTSYKNLIVKYLTDLAAVSGTNTNVFATTTEYYGSNGVIQNGLAVGSAIDDTDAFPTAGCTTAPGSVYGDGSGYTTCLADSQIIAETNSVVTANSLPYDLGHIYVMFTPKHVESCFDATSTQCTINPIPNTSAYCAYHSAFGADGSSVYAMMPFPIYNSAVGYSCTDENLGGGIQSPNGDVDADVEISPLSHEMAEAITDPDLNAWYDSSGFENGDECAYTYGTLSGTDGAHYNQTVNGDHYLTQEEWSNAEFAATGGGCLQSVPLVTPSITSVSPNHGAPAGGTTVTITGTGFLRATSVSFGATPAASFKVVSNTKITAVSPKHAAGKVDVIVANPNKSSSVNANDKFTYIKPAVRPVVTSVSPKTGSHKGGTAVTIKGSGFVKGATVNFGAKAGKNVHVASATKITVKSPAHAKGTVNVTVHTAGGTSKTSSKDKFTFK